jgi:SPP1 family predicted phage head-tail adaptor
MRAGALRYKGSVQGRTVVRDDYGSQTVTWNTVVPRIHFSLEANGGGQSETADQVRAQSRFDVNSRYFAAIEAGMRLVCGDRTFSIISVNDPTGLNRELVLLVSEGVTT